MLPIGSVVQVKHGDHDLMIITKNVFSTADKTLFFDYGSCMYPEGLDPDQIYYFNQGDVENIVFEGLKNDAEVTQDNEMTEWVTKNQTDLEKVRGKVPDVHEADA
ncbi:DUF4176 domain-containing protein [Furfurilactobacillus sp. WILCCON 0119]